MDEVMDADKWKIIYERLNENDECKTFFGIFYGLRVDFWGFGRRY